LLGFVVLARHDTHVGASKETTMTKVNLSVVLLALCVTGCGGASASASLDTGTSEPAAAVAPAEDPQDVHLEGDHNTIDKHINYAVDSDEILADSNDLLDHIALFITNHAEQVKHLRIVGHTDASGGAEGNQQLSDRRAAAVVQALTARGVTIQLEHLGKGESEHLCNEDTAECHAKNRRVEFLVVSE
jgi:outer membrane protein OmpA-like peptidoglycan-associated protein